jgi:DNA-binding CsgD family transcriptional regulator
MLTACPCPAAAEHGGAGRGCGGPSCCVELLCLLRLSEVALAEPEPESGLRAMVDELARLPQVERVLVALPEAAGDRLRHVAHRNLPGHAAHRPFTGPAAAGPARAMAERRMVQEVSRADDQGGGRVSVPILGGEAAAGLLWLGLRGTVPLGPWHEHVLWAAADLMALVLLKRPAAGQAPWHLPAGDELRLTRRQGDVVYELVERGASNEEIAERLGLSEPTVKIHLQAAYRALGVHSRGEAIRLVLTSHADWLARERQRRQGHGPA